MNIHIPRCAIPLALAAALAGCTASKTGPFVDVAARDQSQPSDATPATRPAATEPSAGITVTESATPLQTEASVAPAAAVGKETPSSPANPATPAPAGNQMGKLVVRVDTHGLLTRDFAPSAFERPSGNVLAGPMYWPNRNLTIKRGDAENFLFEPIEFIVDTLMMPVRACITPPWTDVVYDPVPRDNVVPAGENPRQPITEEQILRKR